MKIVCLGATGGTGLQLVKLALAAQHDVLAIVRDPSKLQEIKNERLQVVKGDIFSEQDLAGHFKGVDVVVSCLGFKRSSVVSGYTDSIKPIASAMRTANVTRLVTMTAYYTEIASSDSQGFLVRWLLIPMLRPILVNMREMEKYLDTNCSDLNYTVVRPPGLTNGSSSGKPVRSELDAYFLKEVTGPSRMPRVDVAQFMVDAIGKSELYKKTVAIGL